MANPVRALDVSEEDREVLQSRMQARTAPVRDRERARIVLLAAEGLPAAEIAARVGCSRPTVTLWRSRYAKEGIDGLGDAPRSGAPPKLTQARTDEILAATLAPPPEELGVTHWSSRLLARQLGDVSHVTITRLWKRWHLQPGRSEAYRFSTDPELVAKVTDIVGLYLHPPDNAIVLCVDERSSILPRTEGQPEEPSVDDRRHDTTNLVAALEVATGKVTDPHPRHGGVAFLDFLELVAKADLRRQLHLVVDSDAAHDRADVRAWLARNPRIHLYVTPTRSSWLNLVESFFSIITRQSVRRASFTSAREVTDAIRTCMDAGADRCVPFVWTRTAADSLTIATREPAADAGH